MKMSKQIIMMQLEAMTRMAKDLINSNPVSAEDAIHLFADAAAELARNNLWHVGFCAREGRKRVLELRAYAARKE